MLHLFTGKRGVTMALETKACIEEYGKQKSSIWQKYLDMS